MSVPNDLWSLQNANSTDTQPTWVPLAQAGDVPGRLEHFASAYNPTSDLWTIALGCCGYTSASRFLALNGPSGTPQWTNLSPGGTAPPGGDAQNFFYDQDTNSLYVQTNGPGGWSSATWLLSGVNTSGAAPAWTNVIPKGAPGSPPDATVLIMGSAYNPVSKKFIVALSRIDATGNRVPEVWVLSLMPVVQTGTIQVITNLSSATFTIAGPQAFSGSGTSATFNNAPVGTYTITYGGVNCGSPPLSEVKTLVSGGTVVFSPANYIGNANISVNVAPLGATSATFSISPPVPGMRDTGPFPAVQTNILPLAYTVSFNPVFGFNTPSPQTLLPDSSCQLPFLGNYTMLPGMATLSVTTNRYPDGSFTITNNAGASLTPGGPVTSFGPVQVPAGGYTIKYNTISGYYTPAQQTVTLNAGDSVALQGKYKRLLVISFTGFGSSPADYCFPGGSDPISTPPVCVPQFQYSDAEINGDAGSPGMTRILWEMANGSSATTFFSQNQTTSAAFPFFDCCDGGSKLSAPGDDSDHRNAQDWVETQQVTTDDLVAVIGHSYGGNRARLFVEQLKRNLNIKTDLLVTVDPIDWDRCALHQIPVLGFTGTCDQSQGALVQSAKSAISFRQDLGCCVSGVLANLGTTIQLKGYSLADSNVIPPLHEFHDVIDMDAGVHSKIISTLSDLVGGPRITISPAPGSSRSGGNIALPVVVSVTGSGIATGVMIASASLNGVAATNVSTVGSVGDISVGAASSPITLTFPSAAASQGSVVILTVRGTHSYGLTFAFSLRIKVP